MRDELQQDFKPSLCLTFTKLTSCLRWLLCINNKLLLMSIITRNKQDCFRDKIEFGNLVLKNEV